MKKKRPNFRHKKHTHRSCAQHGLTKLNSTAALKLELEFAFSHPVSIRLSSALALDVISAEHRLIQLDFAQCYKWKAKRLHFFFVILSIEYHSVRSEIESAAFAANKLGLLLSMELHCHIVAEQEYPKKRKTNNDSRIGF